MDDNKSPPPAVGGIDRKNLGGPPSGPPP
jgi:hypothetical protein